ncbi:RagB/SusD family nutrient uptake outer membrane protein [Pedobacter frigoris]|uniref:RagB/SusD family nutrient uptake outer membrane protein n=1 Tax=Pedobacter frigoris TaxID=2571272 RepID=A0A4U1CHC7_9SPHI|nr:RagB/SusD family nutrient uptake outer membrane protein [Pedobacter frigoris]TKC06185.1 RagB/SusD family nutrient uptake outer membrane protein [Pedobacter frigoris]
MKIRYKIFFCLLLSLFTLSCNKWVDVKPTDRLGEDQLFVDPAGYTKAINGVYVEMANTALYGQEMTTGAVDVLAQYYVLTSSTHRYFDHTTFVYTSGKVKPTFDNAWKKAYELIANCNVIIEKCGDAPSQKLPEPYYGIIKGEAIALRAFLHHAPSFWSYLQRGE